VTGEGLPPIDLRVDEVNDFPRYRGAEGRGLVAGDARLLPSWEYTSPTVLWKQPCGGGFSGFAIAGNVLVTMEQRGEREAVVCYDRATGRERWVHDYPARFRHVVGGGPRATPTIDGGRIYAFGAMGDLSCLSAEGRLVWHKNMLEDNEAD